MLQIERRIYIIEQNVLIVSSNNRSKTSHQTPNNNGETLLVIRNTIKTVRMAVLPRNFAKNYVIRLLKAQNKALSSSAWMTISSRNEETQIRLNVDIPQNTRRYSETSIVKNQKLVDCPQVSCYYNLTLRVRKS